MGKVEETWVCIKVKRKKVKDSKTFGWRPIYKVGIKQKVTGSWPYDLPSHKIKKGVLEIYDNGFRYYFKKCEEE